MPGNVLSQDFILGCNYQLTLSKRSMQRSLCCLRQKIQESGSLLEKKNTFQYAR